MGELPLNGPIRTASRFAAIDPGGINVDVVSCYAPDILRVAVA